ncbi:MAG TPA: hypothetical protein VMC41_04700 [Candidatus Nanoarchaeia archaeon]|nr:hypothetical protein [Candidatus Nanoarchaeia archaeon]
MIEAKKSNKIWLTVLLGAFYLFLLAILLNNSFGYLDPDFGWHLKIGEQIWQTKAVPDINHEDYTLLGTRWVDHEWFSNLFIYAIDHNFGYIVLSFCFALLVVLILIIQLVFTRKYFLKNDRGLIFVLFLQGFGLYACLPHLGVRVQEITILLLLLLLIIIYFYNRNKNYQILFWLIPLFIFWASAHGGFLIGLFILGLFTLVKALELWSARKFPAAFIDYGRVLDWKQIAIFAGFSAAALLSTLATPYGWKLYGFLAGYRDGYYQLHLAEWQGQYSFPFVYPQLFYLEIVLVFLALLFFAVFIFKFDHRRQIDIFNAALVIAFTALAIKARRHFPLLFIVSLPIMAEFLIGFFKFDIPPDRFKKFGAIFKIWLPIILSVILLVAGTLIALKINFTDQPEKFYSSTYPYGAIKFLRSHPEWNDRRIFNDYGWGGYLIWQYPERLLFGDGRLPQYPLHGGTVLEEYGAFLDPQKMVAQLNYYQIGLVLVSPREDYPQVHWWEKLIFAVNENNVSADVKKSFILLDYLNSSPAWRSVYDDGTAEVFVKNK